MSYKPAKYPRLVVIRYGCKLTGWPADKMPFVNLSDKALGGIKSLKLLRELWDSGKLKFERATDEDLRAAAEDPVSVLPDGGKCLTIAKPDEIVVVHPPKQLVMHPIDLSPVGVQDRELAAVSGSEESKKRKRGQRTDTKKARARPVSNPTNKPLRRPKTGVKSEPFVLDLDDNEPDSASDSGPSAKRPHVDRYVLVNDPVNEFVFGAATSSDGGLSEDIESDSSGWWVESEAEGIESDSSSWLAGVLGAESSIESD